MDERGLNSLYGEVANAYATSMPKRAFHFSVISVILA